MLVIERRSFHSRLSVSLPPGSSITEQHQYLPNGPHKTKAGGVQVNAYVVRKQVPFGPCVTHSCSDHLFTLLGLCVARTPVPFRQPSMIPQRDAVRVNCLEMHVSQRVGPVFRGLCSRPGSCLQSRECLHQFDSFITKIQARKERHNKMHWKCKSYIFN